LNTPPFDENWFWNELSGFGDGKKYLSDIHFHPELVITGFAQNKDWLSFKRKQPFTTNNKAISTRIINRVASLKNLSSFSSLNPHLYDSIRSGSFLV